MIRSHSCHAAQTRPRGCRHVVDQFLVLEPLRPLLSLLCCSTLAGRSRRVARELSDDYLIPLQLVPGVSSLPRTLSLAPFLSPLPCTSVAMSRDQFICTPCNRTFPTLEALGGHYGTQGHKQRARAASAAPASIPPGHAHCDVCGATMPVTHYQSHLNLPRHKKVVKYYQYERAQQEAQASKCGISLEPADALEFGVVEHDMHKPKAIDYSTSKQFVVKATEDECEIIEARFRKATGVKPRFVSPSYPPTLFLHAH